MDWLWIKESGVVLSSIAFTTATSTSYRFNYYVSTSNQWNYMCTSFLFSPTRSLPPLPPSLPPSLPSLPPSPLFLPSSFPPSFPLLLPLPFPSYFKPPQHGMLYAELQHEDKPSGRRPPPNPTGEVQYSAVTTGSTGLWKKDAPIIWSHSNKTLKNTNNNY